MKETEKITENAIVAKTEKKTENKRYTLTFEEFEALNKDMQLKTIFEELTNDEDNKGMKAQNVLKIAKAMNKQTKLKI